MTTQQTFETIPVGTMFRWRSNLGGQDAMRKISSTKLRNLKTGNEYEPSESRSYFGPSDSVVILKPA